MNHPLNDGINYFHFNGKAYLCRCKKKYASLPPLIKLSMTIRHIFILFSLSVFLISCGADSSTNSPKKIKDLAFEDSADAKEYADLIVKTVRTNRDKVVFQQFADQSKIDKNQLNIMIKTYAQAIGDKRGSWEYVDYYAENGGSPSGDQGYDYTWYDERGRIAIQINVLPKGSSNGFTLDKLEFRSRIDILNSEAFPGGPIDDYKKLVSKK